MGIEKAEGIVLRVRPQGETSKLVQIYSLQRGRLVLIAKGARLPRSKFGGALDVCTRVAMVYYRKETRDVQFLSQVDILERFPKVQTDIARLTLAEQSFELMMQTGIADEANPRLYHLVLDLLRGLEGADRGLRNVGRSFLLHFLELMGFRPNLAVCHSCGSTEITDQVTFEVEGGGYVCARCRPTTMVVVPVTGRVLEWARWLQAVPPSKAGVPPPSSVGQQLDRWLQVYIRYHIEGAERLRSFQFIDRLSRALEQPEKPSQRDGKEEES